MVDVTKWTRLDFGDPGGMPPHRKEAEKEINKDLQKPIQQLVCDVYEEVHSTHRSVETNIPMAIKRMVALMGRVALEHERNHKALVILTWVIAVLTLVLVVFTGVLIRHG